MSDGLYTCTICRDRYTQSESMICDSCRQQQMIDTAEPPQGVCKMMTGHGTLNEWQVCYTTNAPTYLGYIQDSFGNRLHVHESVALKICGMLNELIEALGDIADRYDTYKTVEARSLCEYAYDELVQLGHIVPDESGYPK